MSYPCWMRLVRLWRSSCILLALALAYPIVSSALEVKVSAQALERTLKAQLFSGPDGRYYLRGDAHSACYVYADSPRVSFKDDRVVVHVHTRSKLGTGLRTTCIGVGLTTDADVSLVPQAEGESIGFRDARIERLSESKELNFLLVPFLSRKLPSQMKVNAADLMGKLLSQSVSATGYSLDLDSLKLHSMLVDHNALVVDVDAGVSLR
jgi:hypothetical protein